MRKLFNRSAWVFTAGFSILLQAQDAGAAEASARLDASNRQMLWLAFSLYMAVLGIYLLWSESRLRRLEKSARP